MMYKFGLITGAILRKIIIFSGGLFVVPSFFIGLIVLPLIYGIYMGLKMAWDLIDDIVCSK